MYIYAPYIGDTVPAFTNLFDLRIPFTPHPGVKTLVGQSIAVRILSITDDTEPLIGTVQQIDGQYYVMFGGDTTISCEPNIYYKFQIAYYDSAIPTKDLYYSSVAIGKCIEAPNIIVKSNDNELFENLTTQVATRSFELIYSPGLPSEMLYQYRYIAKYQDKIQDDSGWIVNTQLSNNVVYYYNGIGQIDNITICTNSLNGYETINQYNFILEDNMVSSTTNSIAVAYNIEDACATLTFKAKIIDEQDTDNENLPTARYYEILRRPFKLNEEWSVLSTCALEWSVDEEREVEKIVKFTDNSLEHGIAYEYGCRQYDPITQKRSSIQQASDSFEASFEHMYISDGEKQLCIKYNPKVSSFKKTILEQKTDTIGGQYPFFFRNGQVGYKEIPISGLISYLMDENQMFMSDTELDLIGEYSIVGPNGAASSASVSVDKIRTINLVDYNIAAERKFKLAVLEWLTNGQPKLFRSPTEGNYIVRLMNVSLSPDDKLGRMLHTFTATGYECMECTLDNLRVHNLLLARPIELSEDSTAIADSTFGYGRDELGGFVLNYENSTLGGEEISND